MSVDGAPDARVHAWRADLADVRLKGRVPSTRFVTGAPAQATLPVVPVATRPDTDSEMVTELLLGEPVQVFDEQGGWCWVQSDVDGYVGYVPTAGLTADVPPPTHRVSALATFAFSGPDIKSPPVGDLPLGARVRVAGTHGALAEIADLGFVPACHLSPEGTFAADFVGVAERFIGTPYLWGGRTRIGCDCSGLVQVALQAAGIAAPRDSDMQRDALGSAVRDQANLERGDLVFWKGHVGIMLDAARLLHANGHHMCVEIEPFSGAVARISKSGGGDIVAIRRLPAPSA